MMFKDYWLEEENKHVITTDFGFIAYQYIKDKKEFFITDMFIAVKFRHTGEGQKLGKKAISVAKFLGSEKMTCNVWVKDPETTTRKIRIFNEFGFNIVSCGNGYITMMKEI